MFGGLFGRRRSAPSSPELGALGTHAFVVTEWQPGPTTWRMVNPADSPQEPLRRTRATRGALVLNAEKNFPLFQGERTPAPGEGVNVADYIEHYAIAMESGGYPS